MPAGKQFDYFLLSYVPNVVLPDSIHMAVVLFDAETGGENFCRLKTVVGWQSKVKRFDRNADVTLLEAIVRDIDTQITNSQSRDVMLDTIENSFSSSIHASTRKRYLGEDPEKFLETLSECNAQES